jgi:hypothetical protein
MFPNRCRRLKRQRGYRDFSHGNLLTSRVLGTRGFLLTQSPDAGRGRAAKVGKGYGGVPRLRDALSRGLGFKDS